MTQQTMKILSTCQTTCERSANNLTMAMEAISNITGDYLVRKVVAELRLKSSIAALSIINAHDQRKPQKQILKTLQDMVTDNPNWSDLTEETKKDILNFNLE